MSVAGKHCLNSLSVEAVAVQEQFWHSGWTFTESMAYVSLFTFCGFNITQPLESDFRVELSHRPPSPTGACDVFMNSRDADMFEVPWQACLHPLIFLPLHSRNHTCCYVFNMRICRQKAGTETDRWIKIWSDEDVYRGSVWIIANRQNKLVLYDEMVQLCLCVRTCFAWHVVSNDELIILSVKRLFEYRKKEAETSLKCSTLRKISLT